MTSHMKTLEWLPAALFSLALAGSASLSQAQTAQDYIVNQFDDGVGGGLWGANYGTAPMIIEYDATQDRGPGANPGAMKCTIDFNLCSNNVQRDFERVMGATLDLTKYTKVHFSVKVDTNSSHLSDWGGGAFGNMRFHVRKSDWSGDSNIGKDDATSQQWVGSDAYGTWKDYAVAIDQTTALATKAQTGILGIDIWSGWGSCAAPIGHTNTVVFWMDNIWFEFNTNTAPIPPPMVGLKKAGLSGVQITLDTNGDQYQRDAISTPSGGGPYHWTGQGSYPVSYSMTIADFPDLHSHTNFEAHMYLINKDTAPNGNETYGGADWNVPDIFILRIENNYNATNTPAYDVLAQIQLKTNLPNANPPNDAIHRPAIVHGTTAVGTWTLTFADSTHATLTGPGITTNFTLSAEVVTNNFSPAASFMQFGMFKNDVPNDGHNNQAHGTYSQVAFTGAVAPFSDNFNGPTLTNIYAWRKTSDGAVQYVTPGTAWFLDWTLPANGFNPQSAPALTGPWSAAGNTSTYQSAGKVHAMIPGAALPAGNSTFFRLIHRPFTKLQVLMPGEMSAPNTVSGKTGTPGAQTSTVPFNVTVNAVDSVWNIVASSDTVHITSSEGTATLPADAALVLGTKTFSVTLNASGSWTVTATDVTDGTKTANTGTAVTIP